MLYLVTYELVGKEADYAQLWDTLKGDGGLRILTTNWLVDSELDSIDLIRKYLAYTENDDRMFVCEAANPAWYRLKNEDRAEALMNG